MCAANFANELVISTHSMHLGPRLVEFDADETAYSYFLSNAVCHEKVVAIMISDVAGIQVENGIYTRIKTGVFPEHRAPLGNTSDTLRLHVVR